MRTASTRSILIAALASAAAMTAHAQGTKISALPNASALTGSEKLPAVQGAGNVAITPAQIRSYASNAIDIRDYGVTAAASDNATGLQNAINAAVAAGRPLYVPSAGPTGCYRYTAPLTVAGNLRIQGDHVSENWNGGINAPLGTPVLGGSVLCPSSNGSAGISLTAASINLSLEHIGIRFQTAYAGTGDGVSYLPASNAQGLSGATWNDVVIAGHDGDHYAVNLQNPIYGTISGLRSYGGGGVRLNGNGAGNYGNMVFNHPTVMVIAGGTANAFDLSAASAQKLNLISMVRPQANVINDTASPGGNPATAAQYTWKMDTNVTNVRLSAPDFETNVSAKLRWNQRAGNDPDWSGMFSTVADYELPAWGASGAFIAPQTRTLTDYTSSGTVSVAATHLLPGVTVKASSPTTYTAFTTLYVQPPTASTNVSVTRNSAIHATGQIYSSGSLASDGGLFANGTVQLNKNQGASTTEIGSGSTSGAVTIGGSNNSVSFGGKMVASVKMV